MKYIPIILSEVCIIIYYFFRFGEGFMSDTIISIILAAAAILGPIVTIIISKISLSQKLGSFDDKSLKSVIDDDLIKGAIGFYGGETSKSLSEQHEKIIDELTRREKMLSKKIKTLNANSKEIYKTAEAVNFILEDWVNIKSEHTMLLNKVNELTQRLNNEKEKNVDLVKCLGNIKQENASLCKENELLREMNSVAHSPDPYLNFLEEIEGGDREETDEDELEL